MLFIHALLLSSVLVAAVPHGQKHLHLHLAHSRRQLINPPRAFPVVQRSPGEGNDTLPVAASGQCGGTSGFGCAEGFCCSQWGYCGQTSDYCGAGCLFGACRPASSDASQTPPSASNASVVKLSLAPKAHPVPGFLPSDSGGRGGGAAPEQAWSSQNEYATSDAWSHWAPTTSFVTQYMPGSSSSEYIAPTSSEIPAYRGPAPTTSSTVAPTSSSAPTPFIWSSSSAAPASPTLVSSPSSSSAPVFPTPVSSSSAPAASSYGGNGNGADGSGFGDTYVMYTGDGSTGAGWPSESDWMSFDDAWSSNMQYISISCTQFGVPNNSDEENEHLKSAIQSVASESGIDERFILAVVMQESKGCVRAPTTAYSVTNPGLMQSHNGRGSCNNAAAGGVQNPCPMENIRQQIQDGTLGTLEVPDGGDGLAQTLKQAGCDDVSKYYKAARIYNSGRVTGSDLGLGVATHCYAADIANRLTGWVKADCLCTLDG